ncbi:unnamed protein product [Durusdinium trenchii]|uniref:DUF4460 domain-containing protein n=1 Tax=Durusdinium trenchii TaxID=1381693 RepID=A0ABP0KRN9_9DINO
MMGGGGYYPPEPPHPFRHEYPPSFGRPWPGPGYQPSMSSTRASLGTGSEMGSEPPDGDGDDEGDSAQSSSSDKSSSPSEKKKKKDKKNKKKKKRHDKKKKKKKDSDSDDADSEELDKRDVPKVTLAVSKKGKKNVFPRRDALRFLKYLHPDRFPDGLRQTLTDEQIDQCFFLLSGLPPFLQVRELRAGNRGKLTLGELGAIVLPCNLSFTSSI